MLNLNLGEDNYDIIRFNQYDRNYPFYIKLNNYVPTTGDIVKIEWTINSTALIQTDYITIDNNVLTVNLPREIALNDGRGYFNVVVENTINNSRRATFKSDFEIVGNSINEDTVTTELVETTVEKLINQENSSNAVYNKLVEATNNAELNNYVKKSGSTMTGAITFSNTKGIMGTKSDGTTTPLARTTNNDINAYGDSTTLTRILSKDSASIYYNGKDRAIFHEGNGELIIKAIKPLLLELQYPIGSIKLTADNINPSTNIGGTWVAVGQGKFIVGVGTSKDKNGATMSFEEGTNEGEYYHKITMNEIPAHKCSDEVQGFGLNQSGSFENRVLVEGTNSSMNITNPSFGLYIWKRVA